MSKGYGFIRFGDEAEKLRAMREMNGQYISSRQAQSPRLHAYIIIYIIYIIVEIYKVEMYDIIFILCNMSRHARDERPVHLLPPGAVTTLAYIYYCRNI